MKIKFFSYKIIILFYLALVCSIEADPLRCYDIQYNQNNILPKVSKNIAITPGSGLDFIKEDNGSLYFISIGDKGPRVFSHNKKEVFLQSNYYPFIAYIKVGEKEAIIDKAFFLKDKFGAVIKGRSLQEYDYSSCGNWNISQAFDPEGISYDKNSEVVWIVDEYGPSLLKFSAHNYRLLKLYSPKNGLPSILCKRMANRGFEGIANLGNGKIAVALQSVLNLDKDDIKQNFILMALIDEARSLVELYAYPIKEKKYRDIREVKIGGLTALPNGDFLVIEQGAGNKGFRQIIYRVSLQGAEPIKKFSLDNKEDKEIKISHIVKKGITPLVKYKVLNLRKEGWRRVKAEGIAFIPFRREIAVISDEDFGVETSSNGDFTINKGARSKICFFKL